MDRRFHIEKNVKDLEYTRTLNSLNTYIIILATFTITLWVSGLPFLTKIVTTFLVALPTIVKINDLHNVLESKLQEIRLMV